MQKIHGNLQAGKETRKVGDLEQCQGMKLDITDSGMWYDSLLQENLMLVEVDHSTGVVL